MKTPSDFHLASMTDSSDTELPSRKALASPTIASNCKSRVSSLASALMSLVGSYFVVKSIPPKLAHR